MTFEVEFKAWVDEPHKLEAHIAALAEFVGEVHKRDIYFRPAGTGGAREHFRLRLTGGSATVTTKFRQIVNGMEHNDEIEFGVTDPHALCRWAERFGFEPFVVKEKRGRVYTAEGVTLELNEVANLGTFVEVEILSDNESQVEAAHSRLSVWAERLGIPPQTIEPTPYTMLLQRQHPIGYVYAHDDPEALVREVPHGEAGRQDRLL